MSKKDRNKDQPEVAAATEAPATEAIIMVKKILPPDGANAIIGQYVKVGETFQVSAEQAEELLRHGEFVAVE